MRFKKVIGVAAVLAFAAGAAFAQPVTDTQKADSKSAAKVSRSITFTGGTVTGYGDLANPQHIILSETDEASPIVLTRSFRDALKENCDKEMLERLVK